MSSVEDAQASFQEAQTRYEDAWRALDDFARDDVRGIQEAYVAVDQSRIEMFRSFDRWHYLQRTSEAPMETVRSLLYDMLGEESLLWLSERLVDRLNEQLHDVGMKRAVQTPVLCPSCR